MQPAKLLDKTNKMRNIDMSPVLRSHILKHPRYREAAKKFKEKPDAFDNYREVKKVMDEIDSWRGSCPECGGRSHWRNGVGFEHEKICGICWHTWEP